MHYVIRKSPDTIECLPLSNIASDMAGTELNDLGFFDITRFQEKTDENLQLLIEEARKGHLCVTRKNGLRGSVDEIIADISPELLAPDDYERMESSEELEIYTFLPMLNKWGAEFGYTFSFANHDCEITKVWGGELIQLGRKHDPQISRLPLNESLNEAAIWLTRETGNSWSNVQVLRKLCELSEYGTRTPISDELTAAYFYVPKSLVFGIYRGNPKYGGEFKFLDRCASLPLSMVGACALLRESTINIRTIREAKFDSDIHVCVEPEGESICLTLEMIKINGDRLMGLLQIIKGNESHLMPMEYPESFTDEDLICRADEENESNTWHVLNDIGMQFGWGVEEFNSLLETDFKTQERRDIALLKKLKQRKGANFYELAIAEWKKENEEPIIPSIPSASPVPTGSVKPSSTQESAPFAATFQAEIAPTKTQIKPQKGITKTQVLMAFEDIAMPANLSKLLSDKPKWIKDGCLDPGKPGKREGIWEPIVLAIALFEKRIVPKSKLTKAFYSHKFLSDWRDEWNEQSDF